LQAGYIQSVDGKGAVATLGAAFPAGQPTARAPRRIGKRRIHELHKFLIANRPHIQKHTEIDCFCIGFRATLAAEVLMEMIPCAVIPGLRYRNAPAAIDWLCAVFGFERHAVYPGEGNIILHAELVLGNSMIMLGTGKDDESGRNYKTPQELGGVETAGIYIVVPDTDAACARAVAANAEITRPVTEMHYGSREFTVRDPEGRQWSVGDYNPWKRQTP
jgi:uncharacterized glyoxalase superfamily protein PhnB